jgi:uncharacterized protein YggE
MKTLACLTVIALAAAAPSLAQDRTPEPSTIVVTGEAEVEAQPDRFVVDAAVQGRGDTQVEALRALAGAQSRLLNAWPRLEGLSSARATTGDISLEPRHDPACENTRREDSCRIVAYIARTGVSLSGAPAELAGEAVSLASELGANSAHLDEYGLSDRSSLREQANRAAFEDARRQATLLAEASGRRLGRIVRIQDPTAARQGSDDAMQIDEVVVTGSRVRPAVSIEAAPEPVVVRARLTVVFEIE